MNMDIKKQLVEFYEKNADFRENSQKSWWKIMMRDRFLFHMKERGLTSYLEIGAGTGQDSVYFKENGLKPTCIDLSPRHVGFCLEKGLEARVMDFYELDFKDGMFQGLFAMNCLLHVPFDDLGKVLGELRRVMTRDGIAFIGNYGGRDTEGVIETSKGIGYRFFSSMGYNKYKEKLIESGFYILESGMLEPSEERSFNYFILGKIT